MEEDRRKDDEDNKLALQFMDSLHNYLSLTHSLSSTLRQGWLELASAKHSMGTSRVNTSVLDLKSHSASTTLKITENDDGTQPQFTLQKWVSSEHESTKLEDKNEHPQDSDTKSSDNDEVRKERDKSLSVFGVLISPKLRATQLSFEKALETLIDIANMRSSVLNSFTQLHKEVEDTKE
ncbi:unnamed protein product [Trifolium pratense]|uniref:Uncharacterized protein n=1 Tax=Trifolium pratense TaxID=57577 RepID=A0ACB0JDE6_TRIPR|nr:unnamed protein product [Trifolium pratense]